MIRSETFKTASVDGVQWYNNVRSLVTLYKPLADWRFPFCISIFSGLTSYEK